MFPLVDQLTDFAHVTDLKMIHNLFNSYREINKTNLEENAVKMMGPYNPAEPLACLIDQLEKEREFALVQEGRRFSTR